MQLNAALLTVTLCVISFSLPEARRIDQSRGKAAGVLKAADASKANSTVVGGETAKRSGSDDLSSASEAFASPDWWKLPWASETKKKEECAEGITCKPVFASNLTFDCHFAGERGGAGDVMLLHGFPEWSSMYFPLMRILAQKGYFSVACDQRGYSKGASPENEADYNYNLLRDDIFAVADSVNFSKFHTVAHDHGAVLGWYAAGSDRGKERFLSFTSLSIPHDDAFASGLYGKDADLEQQMGSQYFTMFVLPDSASIRGYAMFLTMGLFSGFTSARDFQKALWWYNGAMDVGVLSMPPLISAADLRKNGNSVMAGLRWLYGGTPNEGLPQKVKTGNIIMPSLFVCGASDAAIACNRPYALKTAEYCTGGYQHLVVDCGHDPLNCASSTETQKVMDAIVNRIVSADSSQA